MRDFGCIISIVILESAPFFQCLYSSILSQYVTGTGVFLSVLVELKVIADNLAVTNFV